MAEPLASVLIETDVPRLAWADGLQALAPQNLAALLRARGERVRITSNMACDPQIMAAAGAAALALRERAAYTPHPPASSRTRFCTSYILSEALLVAH